MNFHLVRFFFFLFLFLSPSLPLCRFVEAECTGLDHTKKTISVTPLDEKMTSSSRAIKDSTRTRPAFEIGYDKLVVAVGAENNTFGTPGVYEHAHFLKEIVDARRIRAAVIDAFESACNPGQTDAERQRLLNFVVVGGGPTGVEFAAELADLVHQDLQATFPQIKNQVKIQLVEAMETVLSMFDKRISEYTEQNFKRESIDVLSNTFVKEVREREIIIQRKGSKTLESIPCSLVGNVLAPLHLQPPNTHTHTHTHAHTHTHSQTHTHTHTHTSAHTHT